MPTKKIRGYSPYTYVYAINNLIATDSSNRFLKLPKWLCPAPLMLLARTECVIFRSGNKTDDCALYIIYMLLWPTWVCQQWRWPCAPEVERQTLGEADVDSRRRRDIQSPHVPDENPMAYTALSPIGKRDTHTCSTHKCDYLYTFLNTCIFPHRMG